MSTDHALPRAATRERVKRKPEGRPPSNTWWKIAVLAATGLLVFIAAVADGQFAIAAIIGFCACRDAQKAWKAWPWYRDGHRPTPLPSKSLKLLADVLLSSAIGLVVVNTLAFLASHHATNAAFAVYFVSFMPMLVEDRRLYRPGGWLRGRRRDPDEDGES